MQQANLKFDGRTALITGAGIGIGYAVCRALAREGAAVALNDMDPAAAEKAAAALNEELGVERVYAYPADVADIDAMRGIVQHISERFGGLHICVANAGITQFGKFLDYRPEQ